MISYFAVCVMLCLSVLAESDLGAGRQTYRQTKPHRGTDQQVTWPCTSEPGDVLSHRSHVIFNLPCTQFEVATPSKFTDILEAIHIFYRVTLC